MGVVAIFTVLGLIGLYAYDELSKKITGLGCTLLIIIGLVIFALLDNHGQLGRELLAAMIGGLK